MTEKASARLPILKRLVFAGILACALVVFFVSLARRETPTEKEIKRLLAELRAAGEPIDTQDLLRMFPDPSTGEDAELLFARAFAIATNNTALGSTPSIMSGGVRVKGPN